MQEPGPSIREVVQKADWPRVPSVREDLLACTTAAEAEAIIVALLAKGATPNSRTLRRWKRVIASKSK